MVPSASTTVMPSTLSRGAPEDMRRGPILAAANRPPMVVRAAAGEASLRPRPGRARRRLASSSSPSNPGAFRRQVPRDLAAAAAVGEDLAGIAEALGVEDQANPVHDLEIGLGEEPAHEVALLEADAVLAAHGAAELDA